MLSDLAAAFDVRLVSGPGSHWPTKQIQIDHHRKLVTFSGEGDLLDIVARALEAGAQIGRRVAAADRAADE